MRKAILAIFIIFLTASSGFAATKMFGRDCTGATGDTCTNQMSAITGMTAGDWCTVPNENDRTISWYQYAASGVTEVYPTAIADDNNAGAGWNLARSTTSQGSVQFSISDPENLPTSVLRNDKSAIVWYNNTGLNFTITTVRAMSDTQDYTFKLYYSGSNSDVDTTNDTDIYTSNFICAAGSASTGWREVQQTFTNATIPTTRYLLFVHTSGTAEGVHVYIEGYLN